jgi:RNA polymerase subunit RPABC4/transcription elongation factor Spt4
MFVEKWCPKCEKMVRVNTGRCVDCGREVQGDRFKGNVYHTRDEG